MKRVQILCSVLITCCYLSVVNVASGASSAKFVQINNTSVRAISADGKIVLGESPGGAALWTQASGLEVLPLPANYRMFSLTNLSGDGSTIVGGIQIQSGGNRGYEGFRWTRSGGYQLLGRFSTDRFDFALATDASYDGSVVVGMNETPNGWRPFRWTQSTGQVNLGTFGGTNRFGEATGVSADGSIIVGPVRQGPYHQAYRWTESSGYDVIGLPSGTGLPNGGAEAISVDGLVIAGFDQVSNIGSWTWTEQTGFAALPNGGCDCSVLVQNMSFDGSIIVGGQIAWNQPTPGQVIYNAVLWQKTATGYQLSMVEDFLEARGVNLAGWHLSGAWDVSYDGRALIGEGTDPRGVTRSWYAMLAVPEPQSLVYVSMTFAMMFLRRRRSASHRFDIA